MSALENLGNPKIANSRIGSREAGDAEASSTVARQRCIDPKCGAIYGLNERLYVCPRCGGLLDVEENWDSLPDPSALRELWQARMASLDARDRSGVWRYRELLPFADDVQIVSLAEGNTPLYDAPRSAAYCGLSALRLKHQGCNPTGSFKDTGHDHRDHSGAHSRRARCGVCQHREYLGQSGGLCGARGTLLRDPRAARASESRKAGPEP